MEEFVYKIRNKRTGQFGDGRHYAWYDSGITGTTLFTSVGPPKAVLTKWKKYADRVVKTNKAWAQQIYDFVEDAEIVRYKLVLEVTNKIEL